MVKKNFESTVDAYKQLEADRKTLANALTKCEQLELKLRQKIEMSYVGVKTINIEKVVQYLQALQEAMKQSDTVWAAYQKLDRRLDKLSA